MIRRLALAVATMTVFVFATSPAFAKHHSHHRSVVTDANGNAGNGPGSVISHKTGATAHVGAAYAAAFQGYIDDLEAHGASIYFMGGIRRGHCGLASMHPCGKALDTCQLSRGRVAGKCHLPGRDEIARIASAHGLFEGGQWCRSDYGHAQVGETAPACGSRSQTILASARSRVSGRNDRVAATYADPLLADRLSRSY